MASKVEACNFALGRLAIGDTIESFDEGSQQAIQCRLWFDQCRREVLRDFPWAFAKKQGLLALLSGQPLLGWTYAYAYPQKCITIRELGDQSLLQGIPQYIDNDGWWWISRAPFDLEQTQYLNTWEVALKDDGESKIILSNLQSAYVIYTFDVTNLGVWPDDAVSAFSMKLASEIGGPLKADVKWVQNAIQQYDALKLRAMAKDANENRAELPRDTPSIRARFS